MTPVSFNTPNYMYARWLIKKLYWITLKLQKVVNLVTILNINAQN